MASAQETLLRELCDAGFKLEEHITLHILPEVTYEVAYVVEAVENFCVH